METKATLRYLRIAPRKVRLVADLIRGKKVSEAQTILRFAGKKAQDPFRKTIRSAISSATHNFQIDESNLYIAKIVVDEGPKLKRYRPRARGRAYPIQKKTSHITLVLRELVPGISDKKSKSAQGAKVIVGSLPESSKTDLNREKQKLRAKKEIQKTRKATGIKRFFRRKAV